MTLNQLDDNTNVDEVRRVTLFWGSATGPAGGAKVGYTCQVPSGLGLRPPSQYSDHRTVMVAAGEKEQWEPLLESSLRLS